MTNWNREKFEKLANEYLTTARRWGPRIELQATIDLGVVLSRKDHLPELALEYLTKAAGRFDEDTSIEAKKTVGIERGRRLIAAGKADDGIAALTSIREEFPFDVDVLYALARQAEKDNRIDEALGLFGELQVLPQLEQALDDSQKNAGHKLPIDQSPRRIVSRLWTQQHGDTRGLPAWLNELYEKCIKAIAADKLPSRGKGDGTRVVLCELFTGVTGAGSVAADVALSALQSAATPAEVIAVRYHVSVPAPDPLANEETQERFKMYGGATTGMLLVDGRFLPMVAGGMSEAPAVYRRLRTIVETGLKDQIDLSLELSAKADKGQIAISVKALGLKSFPPNTRLQVVLVEDKIEYAAGNGIRFHEMVARNLPAGIAGVAPVQGELSFKGDVDIGKLKQKLARQMDKAEREGETPFDAKPLDLYALARGRVHSEWRNGRSVAGCVDSRHRFSGPRRPDKIRRELTMRFALLGEGPKALAVAQAIVAHPDHQLVRQARLDAQGGPHASDTGAAPVVPGLRLSRNWEELLTDAEVDAVIVGGEEEELQAVVRQLVQAGKAILVAPELVQSAAFFYELALVEAESPGRIFPMLALRGHSLVRKLQELIAQKTLGQIRHVQIDRRIAAPANDGRAAVMTRDDLACALLDDADLLRCLCGAYDQVTASRSGEAALGYSLATVMLAGSGAPQAVWTATAHAKSGWQLTVSGDLSTAVLEGDPDAGRLRLTLRKGDLPPVVDEQADNSGNWLLAAFVSSLASPATSPGPRDAGSNGPAKSVLWGELARAVELVDAVERSVRRRRTIDVYFETPSERGIFKTQMTAVGCCLLMLTLAAVVGYLLAAATIEMPPLMKRILVVLIFLPLGAFLALQLLVFVARPATRDAR